jgi:hypothetical protein
MDIKLGATGKHGIAFISHEAQLGKGGSHEMQHSAGRMQASPRNIFSFPLTQMIKGFFNRFESQGHRNQLLHVLFRKIENHSSASTLLAHTAIALWRIKVAAGFHEPLRNDNQECNMKT